MMRHGTRELTCYTEAGTFRTQQGSLPWAEPRDTSEAHSCHAAVMLDVHAACMIVLDGLCLL